jgi:hypothetical protein
LSSFFGFLPSPTISALTTTGEPKPLSNWDSWQLVLAVRERYWIELAEENEADA